MSTVNVGIIGCGKAGQAQLHWFARNPACRIAGVYDPVQEKAEDCARLYGAAVFRDWKTLAAHADINFVSVCGPESARAEQAVYACQHGKDVLCEKPFANTLAECDQMIAAAESSRVLLMAFFNLRFHPVVNAIDEIVADLGPIYASRISYTQFRTGVSWRHKLEQGGGVLKSQGVHPVDLAIHWIGPVASVGGEMMIVHPEREVEDFALATLRFASGAVGEIYSCYTDRQEEAMYGDLQGMAGKISFVLSPYRPELNRVLLHAGGSTQAIPLRQPDVIDPVYPGLMDGSKRAVDHMVECVATRTPSPLNGVLGRQSIEIVLAAYESQRRGTKVCLPLKALETVSLQDCFPHFDAGNERLVE